MLDGQTSHDVWSSAGYVASVVAVSDPGTNEMLSRGRDWIDRCWHSREAVLDRHRRWRGHTVHSTELEARWPSAGCGGLEPPYFPAMCSSPTLLSAPLWTNGRGCFS